MNAKLLQGGEALLQCQLLSLSGSLNPDLVSLPFTPNVIHNSNSTVASPRLPRASICLPPPPPDTQPVPPHPTRVSVSLQPPYTLER